MLVNMFTGSFGKFKVKKDNLKLKIKIKMIDLLS